MKRWGCSSYMSLTISYSTLMDVICQIKATISWLHYFGKVNEFKAIQLETKLSSLIPDEHVSIENYLAKFKSLVTQLKGCGKTKLNSECIFLILSKLKGPY